MSTATVSPTVLLVEDFTHYREGETTTWGPSTFVKTGLDGRHWLVSNVDGPHPVGCRIRLPNRFYFQCRYSAYLPEVTLGATGWWKEPVSTRLSFFNGQGAKYAIQWTIKYGNEPTIVNPLGTSLLDAKRHYHTITLPEGTTGALAVSQPTGILQINRDNNSLTVLIDGQAVAGGTMPTMGQLVGFEIEIVKAKNGSLFFTDFKIGARTVGFNWSETIPPTTYKPGASERNGPILRLRIRLISFGDVTGLEAHATG